MNNPKAFISHASEDKKRFVVQFAIKLREKGVDAWLDQWEMKLGDSLVDKIFEEGIKSADIFIIILSRNSVDKPWVKEELNAGFVKRLSQSYRIIPILIDECIVPECLKSTVWQRIKNLDSYQDELDSIIKTIFGISEKPKLGRSPKYTETVIDTLYNLTKIDTIIFKLSCDLAIRTSSLMVDIKEIYGELHALDIPDEEIEDSLEILNSRGYIDLKKVIGGFIPLFTIRTWGFDQYAKSYINDYDLLVKQVCVNILNQQMATNIDIMKSIDCSLTIVNHILNSMESKRLIKLIKAIGGVYRIVSVSPELKRMFK